MAPKFSWRSKLSPESRVSLVRSDEAIMLRVAAGNVEEFKVLFEKYRIPILSYLVQLTGSRAVAEELAQEVFLRVFRHRESYTVESKFTTWLWTIARNAAFDHLKKKRELSLVGDESLIPLDETSFESPEAERLVLLKATREAIVKCLGNLTTPQRDAISLRTFSELSYEEIGSTLGQSVPAVKSLIHRAKAGLVDCLKGSGYGR